MVAGAVLKSKVDGLNDSKKLTEKKREVLFDIIKQNSRYHIVVIKPYQIDEKGISACMQKALLEIQHHIDADEYLFDGNTNFGVSNLQTMIKADGKVQEVSAASILAKVTHDRNILEDAKKYPQYQFEKHKGYATSLHIEMLKKYGYCAAHRKSYKIKALQATLF